jgi:simple sugar transport system permease protein
MTLRSRWIASPTGLAAATGLAIIGLVALLLAGSGYDLGAAGASAIRGAVGSREALFSATLVRTTPLLLCGLAVALAFRAGVLNIGADGQLLAGAVAAAMIFARFPDAGRATLLPALIAAAFGGALAALVPAVLRWRFGVLEVVSTIMMNFVAVHAVGYLVRGPLQEPTGVFPQSTSIAEVQRLPILIPESRLHIGFLAAILSALLLWWVLDATAAGFRLRVLGANSTAAEVTGRVNTGRVGLGAFLVSGSLAGLAGGIELAGVTFALYENFSPGYGYTAIAVALMGGLHPLGVIGAAMFFGGLAAAGSAMQREAGVPSVVASVVEALVILAVVSSRALLARQRSGSVTGVGRTP